MRLNEAVKLVKKAKSDKEIRAILAQLGSDAQWDSSVGNECTEAASESDKTNLTSPKPA